MSKKRLIKKIKKYPENLYKSKRSKCCQKLSKKYENLEKSLKNPKIQQKKHTHTHKNIK